MTSTVRIVMKGIITNVLGEVEIDPHNCKFAHDKWTQSVTRNDGSTDLHTFGGISQTASELVTQYASQKRNIYI
ncbi:hypothetical protein J4401_06515 [Candidatus Woesearchaeota archaeon]|nr:hypothetical protein [Candidatus Woesearchaeota archaeon]